MFSSNDEVEQLSLIRLAICGDCPSKQVMLGMDVCGICHCPLLAKSRSPQSGCPLGKWETHTTTERIKDDNSSNET